MLPVLILLSDDLRLVVDLERPLDREMSRVLCEGEQQSAYGADESLGPLTLRDPVSKVRVRLHDADDRSDGVLDPVSTEESYVYEGVFDISQEPYDPLRVLGRERVIAQHVIDQRSKIV
jgi:hypothetical protein